MHQILKNFNTLVVLVFFLQDDVSVGVAGDDGDVTLQAFKTIASGMYSAIVIVLTSIVCC